MNLSCYIRYIKTTATQNIVSIIIKIPFKRYHWVCVYIYNINFFIMLTESDII